MVGVYGMLVRKLKENLLKRKQKDENESPQDNLQSVRSWIRKIEQSTTAVSSRLSAVEKRLSTGMNEPDAGDILAMNGRVETLVLNIKKKSASAVARVLDHELTFLHNELMDQKKEFDRLREQLRTYEEMNTTSAIELKTLRSTISQMNETIDQRLEQSGRAKSFVMHLGAVEIPIELTGIIGGLLAFTISGIILIGQKEILLSPVFLCSVGLLLIGVALSKTIRSRSRHTPHPFMAVPENVVTVARDDEMPDD